MVDYMKVYDRFMNDLYPEASVPLVKGRQNLTGQNLLYMSKLKYWTTEPNPFSYSITISPRSSPILKGKNLDTQYTLLSNILKGILSEFKINYFLTFETYSDGADMHAHGFFTISKLTDIPKIKRSIRNHLNISLKEKGIKKKDVCNYFKLMGYDDDSHKRWTGYCYKEMNYMINNNYTPIYRYDSTFNICSTVSKPRPINLDY